jgi:hypothetical protein
MLTIKNLSAKAELLRQATYELSLPAQTGATHVMLTTPLRESEVAVTTSMFHNITGGVHNPAVPNRWPEVQTNMVEINEHAAFTAPISVLVDLWVTRFGNEWVDIETVEEDEFFLIAYKRLRQMAHLEVHYLTDRARYVCRKPE